MEILSTGLVKIPSRNQIRSKLSPFIFVIVLSALVLNYFRILYSAQKLFVPTGFEEVASVPEEAANSIISNSASKQRKATPLESNSSQRASNKHKYTSLQSVNNKRPMISSTVTSSAISNNLPTKATTTTTYNNASIHKTIPNHYRYHRHHPLCLKPPRPFQQISIPQYRDMRVIVINSIPTNTTNAICDYIKDPDIRWTNHFPHAMQQLYRCWSWWNNNPDREPVLLWRKNPIEWRKIPLTASKFRTEFLETFLQVLHQVFHVKRISNTNITTAIPRIGPLLTTPTLEHDDLTDYNLYHPKDAHVLADGIREHFNVTLSAGCPSQMDAATPKIAILNRRYESGRNMMNDKELAQKLVDTVPGLQEVPIVFFEDRSFWQQVEFFSSYDIIISPHGAQLSGIVFMPPRGAILEIFPKGYISPHYFGSLAFAAGLNHAYMYITSGGKLQDELKEGIIDNPVAARKRNVCPNMRRAADAVVHLIDEWRTSCALPADAEFPYPLRGRPATPDEKEILERRLADERTNK